MQVIETNQVGSRRGVEEVPAGVAEMLPPEDRRLLEISSSRVLSGRVLAEVIGCSQGTLSRRARRLRNRLSDRTVKAIARHGQTLPARHRQVAVHVFVRGESLRAAAKAMSLSLSEMRVIVSEVRGWARASANVEQSGS